MPGLSDKFIVCFTSTGVLWEPRSGGFVKRHTAQRRIDELVGWHRRTRIPEPDGWYFVLHDRDVLDVVGLGKMRDRKLPFRTGETIGDPTMRATIRPGMA